MGYYVDIDNELKQAKATFLRYSLIFSTALTITLIADTLLIVFSKENYTLNFIFASLITILFSWYAIFFFSSIYRDVNGKYRYYKNYESGVKEDAEVKFIARSGELTYINGLYVYPLKVKYVYGLTEEEKIIYTLSKDLNFKEGDKLTISTYQRIIMKAEKHS